MPTIIKTPHWRIDHPTEKLSVLFTCVPTTPGEAPHIVTSLVAPHCATPFHSHERAAECFARFLRGQVLDINRIDAVPA